MKKKEQEALEKEQWTTAAWDMLYLVRCGINSIVPDPVRVAKMDLERVYVQSKNQSLEVLTYIALESLIKSDPQLQIPDPNQILSQWDKEKNKSIAKNLMMDAAREQLFAFLEERGIWHMALKGTVLCRMYPKYEMRQMVDNDILFDPSFRQEVHDWFVAQGYDVKSYQLGNHDEYHKKPVYNFEMHVALFDQIKRPQLAQYYCQMKDRLIKKDGRSFEYEMTNEDFYVYIVTHVYKHYTGNGTGIRSLIDLYVCNRIKDSMNCLYLADELNQLGLYEFENEMQDIALKVLSPTLSAMDTLTEKQREIVKELLFNKTHGRIQNYWNHELQKIQSNQDKISVSTKIRYLVHRIFLDKVEMEKWCQQHAPYFLRHRWLMPAAPFWRLIKRGIEKRKQIKKELDEIRKA